MGETLSKVLDDLDTKQKESAAQLKSDLTTLSAILSTKEKQFRQKIITPNEADKTLPVGTIVKIGSEKVVNASAGPSERLNETVEDMFGGEFLKGMKGLILGTLDTVLGRASAGEQEKSSYTVMFLHSAIVRIDYMMYAYTFRSDGIKTNVQNGLVFCTTISTVKLSQVNPETIALLSGLAAENSLSYFKRQRKMCNMFVSNIRRDKHFYDVGFCVGKIKGYFGGDLKHEDLVKCDDLIMEAVEADDDDKRDAAKEAANMFLSALASEHAVGKTDEEDIMNQQVKLLENMTKLYLKIKKMKIVVNSDQNISDPQDDA